MPGWDLDQRQAGGKAIKRGQPGTPERASADRIGYAHQYEMTGSAFSSSVALAK